MINLTNTCVHYDIKSENISSRYFAHTEIKSISLLPQILKREGALDWSML